MRIVGIVLTPVLLAQCIHMGAIFESLLFWCSYLSDKGFLCSFSSGGSSPVWCIYMACVWSKCSWRVHVAISSAQHFKLSQKRHLAICAIHLQVTSNLNTPAYQFIDMCAYACSNCHHSTWEHHGNLLQSDDDCTLSSGGNFSDIATTYVILDSLDEENTNVFRMKARTSRTTIRKTGSMIWNL